MLSRLSRLIYRWLLAAGGALYLLTLGLRNPEHRRFLYSIAAHFGYQPVRPVIPKVTLADVVPANTMFQLYDPVPSGGEVTLQELICINALIHRTQPQRLLEIGTLGGRTTLNMVANTPASAEIFTLDLPNTEQSRTDTVKEIFGRRWTQLYGDSLTFDFSALYNSLDFVFIDANHTYDYVRSDSMQALKLLRNGAGVVVWHDYTSWDWEGNTRALNDLHLSQPVFQALRHIEGTTLAYLDIKPQQ